MGQGEGNGGEGGRDMGAVRNGERGRKGQVVIGGET